MNVIETIRAEIKRRHKEYMAKFKTNGDSYHLGICDGLDMAERVLDTLQEPSLPSNLDEAANVYSDEHNDDCFDAVGAKCPHIVSAFKAGAEWMAQQGDSFESTVLVDAMGNSYVDGYYLTEKIPEGDKVIVQIRKK